MPAQDAQDQVASGITLARTNGRWTVEVDHRDEQAMLLIKREHEKHLVQQAAKRRRRRFGPKNELGPSWEAFVRGWRELWYAIAIREQIYQRHPTADGVKTLCGEKTAGRLTVVPLSDASSIRWWCGRCRRVARARGITVVDEFEKFGALF